MAFDSLVAQAVALELKTLIGSRVEDVWTTGEEAVLQFYGPKRKHHLLFSANAVHARLHLATELPKEESRPSAFSLALRRHLEGARLVEVELPPLERVIALGFEAPPIRGEKRYKLMAEIMGRHSNLILVDEPSGTIVDGIKRYSHAVSRYREVLPGRPYLPPPSSGKVNPLTLTPEEFGSLLLAREEGKSLEKVLVGSLNGLSPQMAREVVVRAGLDPMMPLDECGDYELSRLWQAWKEIKDIVISGDFKPTLVYHQDCPVAYAAVELKQHAGLKQLFLPRMSQAVEEYHLFHLQRERFSREQNRLHQIVAAHRKRLTKKIEHQEDLLREVADAERHRLEGETIIANLYRLNRGVRVLEAPNPYHPEEIVKIELDPALSPVENAQLRFNRYRKAKAQAEQASAQIQQARQELDYWESVLFSLEKSQTLEELAEIAEEIGVEKKAKRPPTSSTPRPLRFTSPDGYTVLVGKNNRQNDYLVTRLARPEDVWLHAKGVAGAHVLVRNPTGKPVPPSTLEYAAGLAAFFSRARTDGLVAVDYTLAKHVFKVKGAKPGMVYYSAQKTILVNPIFPGGD